MTSVQFDGVEILTTSYLPRYVAHETAPGRSIEAYEIPREDGSVFVSTRYGTKTVNVSGVLVADSAANLDIAIDQFKELFSREQRQLKLSWGGTTRVYTATCRAHSFERDHLAQHSVPWSAEFVVPDGAGYADETETETYPEFSAADAPVAKSFVAIGSKGPKPRITLTVGSVNWSRTKGIMLRNADTGERMVVAINGAWDTGDKVIIDCERLAVTSDVVDTSLPEVLFYGVFPRFKVGTNNLEIQAGTIPVQEVLIADPTLLSNSLTLDGTNDRVLQSFQVPYTDETFRSISLAVKKVGSPPNVTVNIYPDNGENEPDTGSGAIATLTLVASGVGTSASWKTHYSSAIFTLSANTRYWIVVEGTSGLDGSNHYLFPIVAPGPYTRGEAGFSSDGLVTITHFDGIDQADSDIGFRINAGEGGGTAVIEMGIEYEPRYL